MTLVPEIAKAYEEAKRSWQAIEFFFEHAPDLLLICRDGVVVRASASFSKLGFSDLEGVSCDSLLNACSVDEGRFKARLRRPNGKTVVVSWTCSRANGEYYFIGRILWEPKSG